MRYVRLLPLLAVAVVLASCGGDESDEGAGTTAAGSGEALKVGLVTDVGQLNDRGFNQLAFEGVKRAESELGVESRVIESASDADYVPNHSALAEDGYDVVIGVGFAQGEAVAEVAKEFPDTKFVIIDVDQTTLPGKPDNVVGLLFKEEEVGYLAGYLAAEVVGEEAQSMKAISSVGGMKEPPVDRFIAGYQAGAKAALPSIDVLNGYSQDWDDQAKCKEVALDQIQHESEVVFQVAGGCGLGALEAAKERSVWGIGVDADQSFLGAHILTSAIKRVDQAVFQTIQSVQDGTWRGGNHVFGLKEDGVGLGKISPKVPQSFADKVDEIRRQIVSGQIADIPTTVP